MTSSSYHYQSGVCFNYPIRWLIIRIHESTKPRKYKSFSMSLKKFTEASVAVLMKWLSIIKAIGDRSAIFHSRNLDSYLLLDALGNVGCKMADISFRLQCVCVTLDGAIVKFPQLEYFAIIAPCNALVTGGFRRQRTSNTLYRWLPCF